MSEEDNEKPEKNPITFKIDANEKQLIAELPSGADVPSLNTFQLQNLIKSSGYAEWHLIEDAIAKACDLLGTLEHATEVIVGERLDGELLIEVADDASCAYMSVTPPAGGDAVTIELVLEALTEKGITQGIKKDAIENALANNKAEKCVIAQGTPPQHGEDSTFESLITDAKDARPQINDDGSVDYHEISTFITVNAGDELMRKIPPTQGTDGVDVYAKVISAIPGKDVPFANRLTGVAFDPNDKNILLASTGGQPEVVDKGMTVNPVINVKDVDISVGNIDFDGTVNVQGDVTEGMKILATGDIIVAGMMEGADLEADGDIIVRKGIIGRGEVRTEKGEPGLGAAKLKSGGSVEARFIENAIVQAEGNVTVGELVSHSEISALNQVVVGKKGAKKGHILGGKTKAVMAVDAQVIGSQGNVQTIIEVGSNPELHEKVQKATQAYEEKIEEYEKLSTLIKRLKGQTDPKSKSIMVRALTTLEKFNEDIAVIKEEKEQLEAKDEITGSAKVSVGKHAFPGASITICDINHIVKDRTEAGSFSLENKKVIFSVRS